MICRRRSHRKVCSDTLEPLPVLALLLAKRKPSFQACTEKRASSDASHLADLGIVALCRLVGTNATRLSLAR